MEKKSENNDDPVLLAIGGCDDMKRCARCIWNSHKDRWKEKCPWLDARVNATTHKWGLGCKTCSNAYETAPDRMRVFHASKHHFARFEVCGGDLRLQRFAKHASSPAHEYAVGLTSPDSLGAWCNDASRTTSGCQSSSHTHASCHPRNCGAG